MHGVASRRGRSIIAALVASLTLAALPSCAGNNDGGKRGEAAIAALPALLDIDPTTGAYPGPEQTFVARVAGTGLFFGISIVDGEAVGYLCDGELPPVDPDQDAAARLATLLELGAEATGIWLTGSVEGDRVRLDNGGDTTFEGTLGDHLTGDLTLEGTRYQMLLSPVGDSPDGLYRATDEGEAGTLRVGWVVHDGEVRGIVDIMDQVGSAVVDFINTIEQNHYDRCHDLGRQIAENFQNNIQGAPTGSDQARDGIATHNKLHGKLSYYNCGTVYIDLYMP